MLAYEVWYNEDAKLVREDKRPANPDSTINTKEAVTELHDFKTGIRYVIDQLGGCQIHPLDLVASDTQENMDLYNYNKSIVVDIRDPMRFFSFNDDYKFVGQRTARGIICDVFSNIVPDFPALGGKVNATMEYYFMSSNWNDLPLDGMDTDARAYPVQLVITAPSVYYTRIYNFFDYAQVYPLNLAFDASPCFEENQRLRFKLTFPGNSAPGQTEQWKEAVYHALAIHMKVNPIRVTGLSVETSDFNTYVSAMLLGTSNAAMFEKIQWPSIERTDSKVYKGITMPDECANLCINNTDFICNGYQYCPSDGYACRLLRDRVPSTPVLENATACDAFTRTVDFKATQEPIIKDAYANLVDAINTGLFQVEVMNPSTNSPDMFKAIDVDIISGQPMKTKPLPSMPQQFSYRVENVVPAITRVVETFVWYDSLLDIVRFDSRDPDQDNPYMTTYIHDFTTGVAYEINDVTKKCKISPLSQGAFDVVTGKPSTDGSQVVSMKSPQSMFYLDNSYRYVGQKTVRGIVCDVFESKRGDFKADAYNITDTSIFKYYFQADDWDYVSPDSTDITKSKPVMLEIEDVTVS
ncbi:uncharacterized protein LOC131952328 [Physella acuta]|uniref:uncharacterized protein LOC131952328 n=1 Tax=Physella acuta TaxID=109671 RepID=UPI0027DCAF37|nr:uncharacterized protein LOC131952328 [Physella acuta]